MALKYFWYSRPNESFRPQCIRRPEQLCDSDRLNIACKQTPLSASQQKKLVSEWCDVLPTLSRIRFLWFSSRVPQRLFEVACRMPHLEGLYIKWSGIKDLTPLTETARLRYFHLGQSALVDSIEPLSEMKRLHWLGLELLSKVRDFIALGDLSGLEGLSLAGSMGTTWRVNSLAPLGRLVNLRYLSIANLRSADATLAGLSPLLHLEAFHHAKWWKSEELEEIRRRNPALA